MVENDLIRMKVVRKVTIKSYINECPNHFNGRRSNVPDVIVLHNTGGTSITSAHYWFLNKDSSTSGHFLVGLDGEVRQYVNLADGSYCNGTTADASKKHYYGNATSGVVRTRPQNANFYTVSIECVGNVGDDMTEAQFETVVELIKHIRNEVKMIYGKDIPLNRLHLIGHYEVAPLTRGYCGKNFRYDDIIKAVKGPTLEEIKQREEPKPEPKPEPLPDPVPEPIPEPPKPEENPKTSDRPQGSRTELDRRTKAVRRNVIK